MSRWSNRGCRHEDLLSASALVEARDTEGVQRLLTRTVKWCPRCGHTESSVQ